MKYSVCVIIPCYKDSKTLDRAIKLVYSQSRKVDFIIFRLALKLILKINLFTIFNFKNN